MELVPISVVGKFLDPAGYVVNRVGHVPIFAQITDICTSPDKDYKTLENGPKTHF
jgi:hypothetical protein